MTSATKSIALGADFGHFSSDRTRQGYARKRILKPAGRFLYTTCMGRRNP